MTDQHLVKNNNIYTYWGFGLHITSEIEFPELQPAEFEQADVKLYCGLTPEVNGEGRISPAGFHYKLNSTEFLFEVPNVARYLARNGNTIIIEPNATLTEMRELRIFVLATVFAAILMQRKQLCMHASAILHQNELILICGDSGAGKSTTLAGLIKSGHTVFSDDVVVLNLANNATASYPMMKLWGDAQDKLDNDIFDDRSFSIRTGMNKYGIFFHQSFDTGSYPVKKVLILKKGNVDSIVSETVLAATAFKELGKQVYRPMLVHNNETRALKFNIISEMANKSVVYQVIRPAVCDVKDLVNHIENLCFNES